MIDPKINIRSMAINSPQPQDSAKSNGSATLSDSAVRARAYQLYETHGRIDGRAEQDWYQAEADLRGSGE
jgi:hypothetical protein